MKISCTPRSKPIIFNLLSNKYLEKTARIWRYIHKNFRFFFPIGRYGGCVWTRLAFVDDDPEPLAERLQGTGAELRVIPMGDLDTAGQYLETQPADLLLIGDVVGGRDGLAFVEALQRVGRGLPTIFLCTSAAGRLRALTVGDDALLRPPPFEELLARLHALLRRSAPPWTRTVDDFPFAAATVHPTQREISFPNGHRERLGTKELAILATLFVGKNTVIPRQELIRNAWGPYGGYHSRSLDQYVVRIRKFFRRNNCDCTGQLITIHKVGYLYHVPPDGQE